MTVYIDADRARPVDCGIEGRKLTDAEVGEAFGLLNETIGPADTSGAGHRALTAFRFTKQMTFD
jgi:hypothetical protein